jgi:hypothetical protein
MFFLMIVVVFKIKGSVTIFIGESSKKGYKVKIKIIICFLLGMLFSANANHSFGMFLIRGGMNSGTDSCFGTYFLTVDSFLMDRTELTKVHL